MSENNNFKNQAKLGQYLNTAGIKVFSRALLRNRRLFVPHLSLKSIASLNFSLLHSKAALTYLVFDKDNTLTIPYEREIHPSILSAWEDCLKVYGKDNVAILSNSIGSKDDNDYKEALLIENQLGIKVIRHLNKKPNVKEDILNHFQIDEITAQKHLGVIGDRILSDTVMGNSHGFFTVNVEPFSTKPENAMVKMMREFEKQIIPIIASGEAPEHVVYERLRVDSMQLTDLINKA
ncbi:hypothetical protein FGO68_gene14253 [Halteria grandinella]|uniref:Uncharacterized protein n=1 Tax=Halteria grandinella TaxID=5974 RepID=A0A8J8P233_HALGN|nr:hypothetical protein FGO68_gene14253 [Halteria grandinella]